MKRKKMRRDEVNPMSEKLIDLADGRLTESEAADLAARIEADPELAKELREHRAVGEMLEAWTKPVLQQDLTAKITARVKAENRKRKMRKWGWTAGLAAAAAILISAIFLLPGSEPEQTLSDQPMAAREKTPSPQEEEVAKLDSLHPAEKEIIIRNLDILEDLDVLTNYRMLRGLEEARNMEVEERIQEL
jgi:anti-sigma factor RsiW